MGCGVGRGTSWPNAARGIVQADRKVQGPKSKVQSPEEHATQESEKSGKSERRRLGQVLVDSGVLTNAEVVEVLEIRTLDIIYDLFIWKAGTGNLWLLHLARGTVASQL